VSAYPLMEFVQATVDSNGRAVVTKGPARYGDEWVIKMFAATSTSTSESQLRIYRGVESDSAIVASTYSANQDNASGSEITVSSQDKLVFVWSNATPGSQVTCRIEGDLNSSRR
jgi:hypothetical protein